MRNLSLFIVVILISNSCKTEPKKIEKITEENKVEFVNGQKENQKISHLKDTIEISGKTILILRLDSLRFQSYLDSGKEWIYEVDSDFGFGFSKALDSLNLEGVKEDITDKRFIKLNECKGCPLIIDRDTIDYGYILVQPEKEIEIKGNVVFGSEYYIQQFENYFNE